MPQPTLIPHDIVSFLSDKGALAASVLIATAGVASATMRTTSKLFDDLLDVFVRKTVANKRAQDERAGRLLLRIGEQRPPTATQRRLRQRQRHTAKRLEEVRDLWKKHKRASSWATFVNGMLIAAQYLVGATLASSFVQKSLSPNLTGVLGVLVVVASTIQQRYSPDITAASARARAGLLRRMIVSAEDLMVEASDRDDGSDYQKISELLSASIMSAEAPRMADDILPVVRL